MVHSHVADDWLVNKLSFGRGLCRNQRGYEEEGSFGISEAQAVLASLPDLVTAARGEASVRLCLQDLFVA